MKKRIISALVLCMMTALVSCGEKDAPESSSETTKATTATVTELADSEEDETETTAKTKKTDEADDELPMMEDDKTESTAATKSSKKKSENSNTESVTPENQELPIISESPSNPDAGISEPAASEAEKPSTAPPSDSDHEIIISDDVIVLPFVPIEDLQ